jgi:hypothetical protein
MSPMPPNPMDVLSKLYKLLKLAATGVLALVLGVALVAEGDQQGIVGGCGALLVAAVVFTFIGWVVCRKPYGAGCAAGQVPVPGKQSGILWLGILLTLAPGLLYLYLRYAMYRFDLTAATVLSVPMLVGGLGCIAAGLWGLSRN